MLLIALALLQATPTSDANMSSAEPPAVPQAADSQAEPAEANAPKQKRVCRKVMDPRTPALTARQTVCKYVPIEGSKPPKR